MLSDDIAFRDMDSRHLRGWIDLLLPPGLRQRPSWALLICDQRQLHAAIVSGTGAIELNDVEFSGTSRAALATVRQRLGVSVLLAVSPQVISEIVADADRHIDYDDHITVQSIVWLNAWRRYLHRGVWMSPPLLELVPPLHSGALERTVALLVANPSTMVAYIIADDRKSVVASMIAEFRDNWITEISTHAAIEPSISGEQLSRHWTMEYRHVLDRVGEQFARPSLGVFAERAAVRRILSGPPHQLQTELGKKTLIIDPMPRWFTGLMGGAAAVAVASRGAKRISAFLPERARRMASQAAKSAARRARETGAHPWQVLGFDPIELLTTLQRFYTVSS